MTNDQRCTEVLLVRAAVGWRSHSLDMTDSTYRLQSGHCAGPALLPRKHLKQYRIIRKCTSLAANYSILFYFFLMLRYNVPFCALCPWYHNTLSFLRRLKTSGGFGTVAWREGSWPFVIGIQLIPKADDFVRLLIGQWDDIVLSGNQGD